MLPVFVLLLLTLQKQFGVPLPVLLEREGLRASVPRVVQHLVAYLSLHGPKCPFIFQKAGSFQQSVGLREALEETSGIFH